MADLGIQINARGSNVSAQRRANNVVIEIDNSETKAATEAALAAATSLQQIGEQVEADAAAAVLDLKARAIFRAPTFAAAAAADLSGYTVLRIDGYYAPGDGGAGQYGRVAIAPASGIGVTSFANSGSWFELQSPEGSAIDVRAAGLTASGNQTSRMAALCLWAERNGVAEVFCPFASLIVNNTTDLRGRVLVGNDTALTGYTRNAKAYRNVRLNAVNQSDLVTHPTPLVDRTPKLLWRESENQYFVAVQKENSARGYLLLSFRNNATTTGESIATTSNEPTRWRCVGVQDAVFVGVAKNTYESVTGTWTQTQTSSQFANIIPKWTNRRDMRYWSANQNGQTITFKAKAVGGRFNLALLCGTGTDANIGVTIDGVAAGTISGLATASNTIKVFSFATSKPDGEDVTITLTKNGINGVSVFVIGVNFYELKDWPGTAADHYFYYRDAYNVSTNPGGRADYLTEASSNDFVIRDYGSATYGVHYHGGEQNIVSKWYADGAEVTTLTANQTSFVVSRNIETRGTCTVDWTALPGGTSSAAFEEVYRFGAGGYSNYNLAFGTIQAEEFYTAMFGAAESFTEVVEPVRIDMAADANLARIPAGRCNRVSQRNPATGQKITLEFSVFANEENHYGGPHWRKVNGSYLKFYYGPVLEGQRTFSSISAITNARFEA